MTLLAPLFLLGLLGIGLPLWLHRLQTQNPKRQPISSAMLLEHSEQRLHVQKRLRFLLLLALRIALLALLALAFAQPLLRSAGALPFQSAREHLIIIDTSLSMGGDGRMPLAKAEAEKIIADMRVGERAQIVSAGGAIELMSAGESGATADKNALRRALTQVEAGTGRLEYARAVGSIDSFTGVSTLPVVAHLISDFQASGMSPRFADLLPRTERARSVELQLHPIAVVAEPNWAVVAIRQAADSIDVTVRGYGAAFATSSVKLEVNGAVRGETRASVPAGGEAVARFPGVALNAGDNRITAQLTAGDKLSADDKHYAVLQGGGPQAMPFLTSDVRGSSATFVSAALSVAAGRYRATPVRIDGFDARTLERYPWVTIDDVGAIDNNLAASLRAYVEAGGAVFAASGNRAGALQALPLGNWKVNGVTVRNADPLGVGRVDGAHALLVNTSGWQNIAVARMLKVQPAAEDRVLIATEDGEPLLIERRLGQGRLLLLTTSFDNNWSDLPVQPVFVSFMAEAASWLAGEEAFGSRQTAGATLPLAQSGANAGQVIDPDGRELLSLSATRNAQSVRLSRTGFYQVITPAREALVAVNVDERESDLSPMDAAQLAAWREAASAAQAVAPAAGSVQSEGSSKPLARWLLALLALVVIAESFAGNWLLRRNTRVLS